MADLYRITLIKKGGTGDEGVSPGSQSGQYEAGSIVAISITPDNGYTFINWEINGVNVSSTATFLFQVPSSDVFIVANLSGSPVFDFEYGLKYYYEFKPQQSESCSRLEIYAKNWTDPAQRREMGDLTYQLGTRGANVLETVIGSSIDFELAVLESDDYLEFLEADPRFFQVKYYQFYDTPDQWVFIGYLKTDFMSRPYQRKNYKLQCHASDILNTLDAFVFQYERYSATTAMKYISAILAQTDKDPLPISTCVNLLETRMDSGVGLFEQFGINAGRYYDEGRAYYYDDDGLVLNDSLDLKTVLTYLLKSFVCRIFQWNGRYYIIRLNEWVKPDLLFRNYTGLGVYIDSSTIANTQGFECIETNNGQLDGELSYNKFQATLQLGFVDTPELNTIVTDSFQDVSFFRFSELTPIFRLNNWMYVNTVPFDGERSQETARLEIITGIGVTDLSQADFKARFWGTANGLSDPNLSYIELNSQTQGVDTNVALEAANTITVGATFATNRRGSDDALVPPEGTQLVAIQIQVGSYYLYRVSQDVYDWTLTPYLCTWSMENENVENTLKITDLTVPEDGEVKVRLCQMITISGARHRYVVTWGSVYVNLERNDALVNTEILKIGTIETEFTNIFENYETYIGDARTNLSVSAIKLLDLEGDPVSKLWSRDGVEQLELLDIVIDEIADLYGKNNYRFYLDYFSTVDATKKITIGSADYFVNSCVFNGSESRWELDLFRLT